MNVRLALASVYVPGFVKRRRLRELLCRSAEAFGARAPDTAGLAYRECLRTFAAFTAAQAEAACAAGAGDAAAANAGAPDAAAVVVRARLRAAAYDIGRDARRTLGIATRADAMRAARVIYRLLGIDFRGRADGTIVIRRCGFSRVYSPRACELVSGLDEGLLAGLAGGGGGRGRLVFASRITEGCARCEATFHFEDGEP